MTLAKQFPLHPSNLVTDWKEQKPDPVSLSKQEIEAMDDMASYAQPKEEYAKTH